MAWTERYVSVTGAGAHDGTSEANAWTLAEALAAPAAAGSRVNVISGTYSLTGGTSAFPTGTIALPIVFRGYNATIGDLDNQGWNSDGTLNTTNMPDITIITAAQVPGVLCFLQNLDITGAQSNALISSNAVDDWGIISCRIVNTQNNAAAHCILADDGLKIINSDLYCSGAAHNFVVNADLYFMAYGSRFRGTSTSPLVQANGGAVARCTFYGNSSSVALKWDVAASVATQQYAFDNTFYGVGTCIEVPNSAATQSHTVAINNHATDSSKWFESLHSGTADNPFTELGNRTRDITTLLTGAGNAFTAYAVASGSTGDASTDYVDAANGDFHLIDGAPGEATGIRSPNDIGAYQSTDPSGGSGGQRVIGG